jgi:hypothetical protein
MRTIVAAAVLLLAGQASARALPSTSASKSIKYTDEPDPGIYAAAQASAAAIAYGPEVLLKGPPSGGGMVKSSSLESQNVAEDVSAETPPAETSADPSAGGYGDEATPSTDNTTPTDGTTTSLVNGLDAASPIDDNVEDNGEATTAETPPAETPAAPSTGGYGDENAAPFVDSSTPSDDTTNPHDHIEESTPAENPTADSTADSTTAPSEDTTQAGGTTTNAPTEGANAFSDVNRRLLRR